MRWVVGSPSLPLGPDDALLTLELADASGPAPALRHVVPFHLVEEAKIAPADEVVVHFPPYRGHGFLPVLSWLTTSKLAKRGAEVTWLLDKKKGPRTVQRLLGEFGWELRRAGVVGDQVRLVGPPPAPSPPPPPRAFSALLGGRTVEFAADWGTFSPGRVDDGTALLLDVALNTQPVEVVADIGVGYGPLAVGLVANGVAERAVGTDVDSIALWLAGLNARRAGVALDLAWTRQPSDAEPTALTVCNIPTHLDRESTAELVGGLITRAAFGRLLMVVHASLADRYTRYFDARGIAPARHPGIAHVVLDVVAANVPEERETHRS